MQGSGSRVQDFEYQGINSGFRILRYQFRVSEMKVIRYDGGAPCGGGACVFGHAGFRASGTGFRASGFQVEGSGFGALGLEFWVRGSGFRVQGAGFRVSR
jgi:hypothetical protein